MKKLFAVLLMLAALPFICFGIAVQIVLGAYETGRSAARSFARWLGI